MARSAGWRTEDLDALLRSGLITVDAGHGLHFSDDSTRALVIDSSPPTAVCEAHRRAAAACRELHLPVRLVIDHLVRATLLADDGVADELEEAAARAESEDDMQAASQAWQEAARLSSKASDRVARAVRALQLVIMHGLDYARTDRLLDLLSGEQLSSECACWVEWVKALERSELDPDAAVTAQWTTIHRARDASPGTVRALLWDAAMNAWTLGDAEGGLRAAREYELVDSAGDGHLGIEPPWAATALMAAGLFETGAVVEAESLRRAAIEAAAAVDPLAIAYDRLLSIVFLDDLLVDMSEAASDRLMATIQRTSDESATLACLLGIEAWRCRTRGDWSRADELLARGRPLATATGATGAQLGMAALAVELAALRGADATLRKEAAALRDRATHKGDRRRLATLDHALGLRVLAEGRLDDAIADLSAAADAPFLGRRLRDGVLPARVDLVEALSRRGDHVGARIRAASVRPLLVAMGEPRASALERRMAGLVARGDEAIAAYVEALALHSRSNDPFERARTLLLLGEEERRSRRRADARVHLIEAVNGFDALGAVPWLTRARNELRAAGGSSASDTAISGLTPQEVSVARQAASGLSTREIADALFLSPRTVEFHLASVYRKLGIRGRSGLAPRLGLIDPAPDGEGRDLDMTAGRA